jgi:hypothetical protein
MIRTPNTGIPVRSRAVHAKRPRSTSHAGRDGTSPLNNSLRRMEPARRRVSRLLHNQFYRQLVKRYFFLPLHWLSDASTFQAQSPPRSTSAASPSDSVLRALARSVDLLRSNWRKRTASSSPSSPLSNATNANSPPRRPCASPTPSASVWMTCSAPARPVNEEQRRITGRCCVGLNLSSHCPITSNKLSSRRSMPCSRG